MSTRCEQCGGQCPIDAELCLECAMENAQVEASVMEFWEERAKRAAERERRN